jgi:hypothetical protein
MLWAQATPRVGGVEARTVRLRVDVVVEGSVISGEVADRDGGAVRPFAGRLGLIAAIELALDGGSTDEP